MAEMWDNPPTNSNHLAMGAEVNTAVRVTGTLDPRADDPHLHPNRQIDRIASYVRIKQPQTTANLVLYSQLP